MKRGPYKQYLLPSSDGIIPRATRKRRGITDEVLNFSREEEVQQWLGLGTSTDNIHTNDAQQAAEDHDAMDSDQNDTASGHTVEDRLCDELNLQASYDSSSESSLSDDSAPEVGNNEQVDENINIENDDLFINANQFEKLNDFLKKNSKKLNLNIEINPADIILMILTLAVVHNFTLTAAVDILNIINVICCCNIFPNTRYLFKKLFNPFIGTDIHLVCKQCKHYLGKQGDDGIGVCSNCETINDVTGYKYDYAFITLDIKSQLIEILQNKNCKLNLTLPADENKLSDINCGSVYRESMPNVLPGDQIQYISLSFNVDSTPISKDGKTTITPIYLTINELDINSRKKYLLLAGIWYGKVKPRNDVFLKPFTDTFNFLRNEGVKISLDGQLKIFKMLTICCCVDTVARPTLQGIVGVNGYYCCSWCEIKGGVQRNTIKYQFQSPAAPFRTEDTFRQCYIDFADGGNSMQCKGVNSVTPLINLTSFNMVWGFTPDYLHCVLLGVTKRFLGMWLCDGIEKEYYIGAPRKMKVIDSLLLSIKYPQCLKRKPVSLTKKVVMKGRELENWLLYYSVPVLTGILNERFLNHWKLLVCGISILLQDEITIADINEAELKLVEFVYYVDELYGEFEMTYNIHQVLHLAESCRRWGPLWTHTTFVFESSLRNAKRVLKASRGVPQQIVRSLEMNRALQYIVRNHNCSDEVVEMCRKMKSLKIATTYMSFTNETLLNYVGTFSNIESPYQGLPENCILIEYEKIVKDNIVYRKANDARDRHTDDSYVFLNNKSFGRIKHILCVQETGISYVVVTNLICEAEEGLVMTKRIVGIGNTYAIKFEEISSIAIRVTVDDLHDYVSTIPKKHYVLNL